MPDQIRTWLITGCSTGLGRALAEELAARGQRVFATARNTGSLAELATRYRNVTTLRLDVTVAEEVAAAVAAVERVGGVDVLINNAGFGYRAAIEEGNPDDVHALFAANLFGAWAMIRSVLPRMRTRRRGLIVNISSIAARKSYAGSGFYAATKSAMGGMSEALRQEVEPLGIDVLLVEPGGFRTEFAGPSLHRSQVEIEDYAQTVGLRRKRDGGLREQMRGDPVRAARAIIDVATADQRPVRLLLGSDAVSTITAELEAQLKEVREWASVSTTTDYPEFSPAGAEPEAD